jgi:peroxiredoxin Q/BCP
MKVGDFVQDFAILDHDGALWRLSTALRHGPVVIFFYPRGLTQICTAEACHFRDLEFEFLELGATVVGISDDPVGRQRAFAHYLGSAFPVLSDPDGIVLRPFGVMRTVYRIRRRTFVITPDYRVAAVISGEFDAEKHADEALEVLKILARTP